MALLILFAFLAGVVTILSPCILPILPIILSSSVATGKSKPWGIVTGFVLSFTFFTLVLTSIVKATGVSADLLRSVAIGVVLIFGVSLLIPQTQLLLEKMFSSIAQFIPNQSQKKGFIGGVLVGLSLGLLWTPCVGPILASVITLAVTSQVNAAAVLITLAYSFGTAVPMFLIIISGGNLLRKVPGLARNTQYIQQFFGGVMILTAFALFFNFDRQFQIWVVTRFPQYGSGLTQIETIPIVQKSLQQLSASNASGDTDQVTAQADQQRGNIVTQLLSGINKAADFTGGGPWINSKPLSLKRELKGKVVLVDFWTYTCINCIRTIPYIKDWYTKYKDKGLVIVGVHTPEFEFEKKTENVQKAVKDFGIEYPVVQDNDFFIWGAYRNQYWPAHYLIDKSGSIRYTHFGEGNYLETENAIRALLDEKPLSQNEPEKPQQPLTPETYLGYKRAESYSPFLQLKIDKEENYAFSGDLSDDAVALNGKWKLGAESIQSAEDGADLLLNFQATKVHLVLSPPDEADPKQKFVVKVKLDGKEVPSQYWTQDMNSKGEIEMNGAREYTVLDLKNYGRHILEIILPNGVHAFAFTFG
jgi:cytochrome c biogenesis protein CcdA/thiol-disulfide isomerase/thioredoxin